MNKNTDDVFRPSDIVAILECAKQTPPDFSKFRQILSKASENKGLKYDEIAALLYAPRELDNEMFAVSARIRNTIYGNRIVLFAPLYWSSWCANDCRYCSFCVSNRAITRARLTLDQVAEETLALLNRGHKRILLESGEHVKKNSIDYLLKVIETIYAVQNGNGDHIRRINVNIAATDEENYRKLRQARIGTYNLFQETYHAETYRRMHPTSALKGNFERQLFAMDRAINGGLQDLGMGVLYGLYDWRFEVLALIMHAEYLERTFGVGPHTISVPRICPAAGTNFSPPYPVSDKDFLRIISIIRIAIPYTGMVISTRENPAMRLMAFRIGVSQASAGSKTNPGGYSIHEKTEKPSGQFVTHDERTLDEVTYELLKNGFIPSHCTACEFMGREGKNFLPMAKSGEIKFFCQPNSLVTLWEYLRDYASPQTCALGKNIIKNELGRLPEDGANQLILTAPKSLNEIKQWTQEMLQRLEKGNREYCYV